ncbi:hypothetical protein SAMN04487939_106289 [Lysobacter sp. yr284]|uniref:hypothetical protein n=1 Tax=Lysobacter sp. yr284 TaxID=1761791 RepID=UPI00089494B0|nr:hypothetical protein [Lysobacter sp. yr284]SDY82796.1 hypothetical protein SAMN04487939_106289 [Lysobacter sp. yr284]
MERSPISTSPKRRGKAGVATLASALALIAGLYATQAAALSLAPALRPGEADYRACPQGQAWKNGEAARLQRERLRRPSSAPRDPALRENVLRWGHQTLFGGYDRYYALNAANAAADAAADAAASAADAAADAATPPGAKPVQRKPAEPRVSPAQARAAAQRLREILQRRPMPGVDQIGTDGVDALWQAIYRDHDDRTSQLRWAEAFLDTQRRVPGADGHLIREAMEKVDRLRLDDGRPQRYGTQFEFVDDKVVQRPLESAQVAEAERREFERMPMALEICLRKRLNAMRVSIPGM